MKIKLLSVGHKMPAWVSDAFNIYNDRLPKPQQIELIELPPTPNARALNRSQTTEQEANALLSKTQPGERLIAFDERGRAVTTREWADALADWRLDGRDVCWLVGGADGLHESVLKQAEQRWSLSRLTFPHQLVRVIIAEQHYRAHSLLHNHPYHRE